MKRRDFALFTAALAVAPRVTLAQQGSMPKIGVLTLGNPEPFWTFIREALRNLRYIEGKNVRVEFRSADGKAQALAAAAAEMVRQKVDVLVAVQTPAVQAAMRATRQIPIVMVPAGAPLEAGIVPNLHRPGGNVTGVSAMATELGAKTLEIMREMLPSLAQVAVVTNVDDPALGKALLSQLEHAAGGMNIAIRPSAVRGTELDAAFAEVAKQRVNAVIIQPSLPREPAVNLSLKYRIPAIAPNLAYAEAGALMAYAASLSDLCRLGVEYVDRILKGAKPGDLPIQQPSKFELVINQKTARSLSTNVPSSVLLRADRVID